MGKRVSYYEILRKVMEHWNITEDDLKEINIELPKSETISIRVPKSLEISLQIICNQLNAKKGELIRDYIIEQLEKDAISVSGEIYSRAERREEKEKYSIRVTPDCEDQLRTIAEENDTSVSGIVLIAIKEIVEQYKGDLV